MMAIHGQAPDFAVGSHGRTRWVIAAVGWRHWPLEASVVIACSCRLSDSEGEHGIDSGGGGNHLFRVNRSMDFSSA
jgi:hypothetical protein